MKMVISGTGCALADFLYNGISFESQAFRRYLSRTTGDGGLSPGKLVFTEEFEQFAGKPYPEIVQEILGDRKPDAFNVGGPSVVSLIHAAQLLDSNDFEVKFFGMAGQDETAEKIIQIVSQTPLNIENYRAVSPLATPFTDVLSDPDFDGGHGERTFVNNIGAAWDCLPEALNQEFFDSDIVCFGGTGLVPNMHDHLSDLLKKSKANNCISVVNTVFDFRNEKKNPKKPWPLVDRMEDYRLIDVLIMDLTEALRISGRSTMAEAADFFSGSGVKSFIITNGADELNAWSGGDLFERTEMIRMPVSRLVTEELKSKTRPKGDTTGCGDNFAGGVIASLASQLKARDNDKLDFRKALSWGIASGGFCCFTIGGTYLENTPGEKKEQVRRIQEAYQAQQIR